MDDQANRVGARRGDVERAQESGAPTLGRGGRMSRQRKSSAVWGTDLTTTITGEGQAAVFVTLDHCSAECVGIHAHARATRFQALEPIRQGVRQHFGGFARAIARGLAVRHDHGS
jgi:hypothetical protein